MVLSLDKLKLVNVNVIKPAEPVNTTNQAHPMRDY